MSVNSILGQNDAAHLKISLIVLFNFTSFCDDHFIETLGEAASGEPRAQFELGLHYFNGDEVIQDYTQAVKWWKRSTANGIRKPCMN